MPVYDLPRTEHYPTHERLINPLAIELRLSAKESKLRSPLEGVVIAQSSSPATITINYSKYATVEDILNDPNLVGKNIQKASLDNYEKEIKDGKVVLFFYANEFPTRADGRLTYVMRQLTAELPDVKFIAVEYNRWDPRYRAKYDQLGLQSTPDFFVYDNGRLVFRNPSVLNGIKGGGPKEGEEHLWFEGMRRDIARALKLN